MVFCGQKYCLKFHRKYWMIQNFTKSNEKVKMFLLEQNNVKYEKKIKKSIFLTKHSMMKISLNT